MQSAEPIKFKSWMYEMWERGVFGNNIRSYPDARTADLESPGPVMIRYKAAGGGGGPVWPMIPPGRVSDYADSLVREGWERSRLTYSTHQPDHRLLIQGYVRRSEHYYDLDYNTLPNRNMRDAMKTCQHATGLKALHLMKQHLSGSDWDDLMDIFDHHPDSVVEFTCYETWVGNCPRRQTIIWEVRDY